MVCSERSWPLRWTKSTAVMIMPGVQKPHCRPWCSRKASCIGCSGAPSAARPSMVLTSCPSAITVSVVQDFTALPSRCTTQAPHCEVSQPTWVPVSRRFSRRNCTRRVRGSTFAVTGLPFTISEILAISTLYCLRYRIARQNSHQNQSKHIIWAIPVMSNLARNRKWRRERQATPSPTALAKLAKNSSASFLAVPAIRRWPSWASLPPICASTLYVNSVPPSLSVNPTVAPPLAKPATPPSPSDRKSTRLNSSHDQISYAVFCLKKKKKKKKQINFIKNKTKQKKKNLPK